MTAILSWWIATRDGRITVEITHDGPRLLPPYRGEEVAPGEAPRAVLAAMFEALARMVTVP
jgi:hypothetical protein